MKIGKCLKCDEVGEVTEDHLVPQWFNKSLPNFGLSKLQNAVIEILCKKCNTNKGGKIDFDDARVREVMKKFAQHFVDEIRKREEGFNLN